MSKRILTVIMIILSLPADLSYGSPRILEEIAKKRKDNLNYRLTENVFPEHYTLKMAPHFNNDTFTGHVKIFIHVKIPTDNITLHKRGINIKKEKIYLTTMEDSVINIKDAGETGTKEQEFYTITFTETLKENTYNLHIPEFNGSLLSPNTGFYEAQYTDEKRKLRKFATTFFEATHARSAFPCFDEPKFKAKFKIYIVRPSNYHSVSNAKLIKSIKLNNSLYEDEFEHTVSMSTYIMGFVVSEMKLKTSPHNNMFRVLARPEAIKKGYEKYSLELSVKLLQAFETYLNVNYTLKKMDQVIIPDGYFGPGAVENWGLIIYRESHFLITPQTKTKQQLRTASIVAHELAHQWFGNLVSVEWWRYLWLKEGFANFFQSKILDIVKPEWRLMEQFVAIEKHNILDYDNSLIDRNLNQDGGTPSEIRQLYDKISYDKAGCIIHMLETIMTPNIFRHGLTNYLQDRAFQSAIPTDLYRNLQKAMDKSAMKLPRNLNIEKIMNTWDSQPGYPLVYVERDYDNKREAVKLTQTHYVRWKEDDTSKPSTWYIPINYASKSNHNFNDTRSTNWLLKHKETITIKNLKSDDWLILNKQETFYYRVNYDVENWKLITKALKENFESIHILNRAQIIDDSFNMAKLDKIHFSIPLEICTYLHEEDDDYIIHSVFLRNIDYIRKMICHTNVEPKFQKYVMHSLKDSYNRLGHKHRSTDTLIDKLHRPDVVRWMCEIDYPQCRAKSLKIFEQWKKNNKSLDLELQNDIMCNAVRHGNEDDWNYLFGKYESTNDYEFRIMAFESLGCSENVTILQRFLNNSLNSNQNFSFTETVQMIIDSKGSVAFNVSRNYTIEHFHDLRSKIGDRLIEVLLNIITAEFRVEAQLDEFIELLPININNISFRWQLAFDNVREGISERKKTYQQISEFFQSYKPPNDLDQGRSDGNLRHVLPNIFVYISYSLIIILIKKNFN